MRELLTTGLRDVSQQLPPAITDGRPDANHPSRLAGHQSLLTNHSPHAAQWYI
jgi:hypothetical protein